MKFISALILTFGLIFAGPAAEAQNKAHLLANTRDALNARLDLIARSRSPLLSIFEMSEDSVGFAQLAALVANARAGGHPRLLLDGLGHRLSHTTLQYLASQNVDIRIFHAIHFAFCYLILI